MNHDPLSSFIDLMNADMERRHGWLGAAAEQCRQWKEEDQRAACEACGDTGPSCGCEDRLGSALTNSTHLAR